MTDIVPGSKLIKPPNQEHGTISLTLVQNNDTVVAPSSINSVQLDANITTSTTATIDTAWDIERSAFHFNRPVATTIECSSTGTITNNRLTRVSDGPCDVVVKSGMFIKSQQVTMLRTFSQTSVQWQSWISGSLGSALQQPSDISLPFWSGGAGGYAMGSGYGFTAISPRHVIGAEHVEWMPAQLTLGGVTRNLVAQQIVGPANSVDNYATDLRVGLYDGDFPHYAKVFPSNLVNYIPNHALRGYSAIITNQFGAIIQRRTRVVRTGLISFTWINPSDTPIIIGDSGNPGFFVINGEPILLGCMHSGNEGAVMTIHDRHTEVNAAMITLGGGYQLTDYNLSSFPSY